MSFPILGENPANVNDSAQRWKLGQKAYWYGTATDSDKCGVYQYVQFKDAVTYAAGQVLTWANATCTAVTNDRSGGSSVGNKGAGLATRVHTTAYYGWIFKEGFWSTVKTNGDDDIAAGDELIVATGTDGACDSIPALALSTSDTYTDAAVNTAVNAVVNNSMLYFGQAVAADVDASNTVAAIVKFD